MNIVKYSAVNSKIHALKSNLLTEDDYRELIGMRSIPEIARNLSEKDFYSELFKKVDPEIIHRRDLELLIRNKVIDVLNKFRNLFHGPERGIILLLLKRYEIENLKLAIRNALTEAKSDIRDLSSKFYNLGEFAEINPQNIALCKNTDGVLNALEGTDYYAEIKHILESGIKSTQNIVYILETSLDKWYISLIKMTAQKLSREARESVFKNIGMYVDLSNLEWILRAKKFYSFSAEELYNSLFHTGYRLKKDYLRMACDTKTVDEAIEFFSGCFYAAIFKDLKDGDTFPSELSQRIQRYFFKTINAGALANEFTFSKLFEYLYLVEFEFKDIILITEAVRYSMGKEEIPRYLIRTLGSN
ncbi:MAG: hypothetical protein DRP57_07735 [Spirochaetes bacterium]|nr:MAG: hypothetical protein DRP57_07735 [Spirochaetota bacterium]